MKYKNYLAIFLTAIVLIDLRIQADVLAPISRFSGGEDIVTSLADSMSPVLDQVSDGDVVYFVAPGDGKYVLEALNRIGEKNITVVLIDISKEMLEKSRILLGRQNGNQFQQIQYVTRDVHEINTLAGEGYPLPQFIFVFDALHNFLDAGEAVRKMGEILDDKKGGILAANYPANVLDQTDPAFKGFFRFIGNVETNFLLASQIPKLARPKEKRFRNELVSRMVRGLDGRFDIRIGKTNITQTIRQILTMMSEERDYLERLFAYTPDETVPEAYRTLLRRIQHLKTENSFMKDWKGDPMEFPVTRVWNVLQIQRKGELEYPSGDPTDSAV